MIVMPGLDPGIQQTKSGQRRALSTTLSRPDVKGTWSATIASPSEILANADRLISDAAYLHVDDRCRSAATLIVVAMEQMGAFVEALTHETYPSAEVHMGIFGTKKTTRGVKMH
jgi:hypothetical protein